MDAVALCSLIDGACVKLDKGSCSQKRTLKDRVDEVVAVLDGGGAIFHQSKDLVRMRENICFPIRDSIRT